MDEHVFLTRKDAKSLRGGWYEQTTTYPYTETVHGVIKRIKVAWPRILTMTVWSKSRLTGRGEWQPDGSPILPKISAVLRSGKTIRLENGAFRLEIEPGPGVRVVLWLYPRSSPPAWVTPTGA